MFSALELKLKLKYTKSFKGSQKGEILSYGIV